MSSLRELIHHGEYELAAYRLVYGMVHACVEGRESAGITDADSTADPVRQVAAGGKPEGGLNGQTA